MVAGMLLFLVLPLVMGGIVYALRRWGRLSALLSFLTTLALGTGILVFPLGQSLDLWGRQIVMGGTVSFLGRELILEEVDRVAIAFLYLTASGVFLFAWRMSPRSLLFPVGFGMLSLLSGSLLIRPLIYAVLLVEIAVVMSVFALQMEGGRAAKGGLQYVSFSLLAMPGLLVIQWLMDRYALTPDNVTLRDTAAVLLTLSFALLMGSIPFHVWMPSVAGDSEPLASAFVFTVNYGAIWFLFLAFLETYPDLTAYARFGSLSSWAGLGMVSVGGLLGAAQRRPSRLLGYGALVDGGVALIALGSATEQGLGLAFLSLLVRPFGLVLMAAGVRGLRARQCPRNPRMEEMRGLGRNASWSALAFLIGGVSTAGLPVSAGFAGRWSLYRAIGTSNLTSVLAMMLASVGVMVGVWRTLAVVLSAESAVAVEGAGREGERWADALVVVLGVGGSIVVGLAPQLVAPTAARLAGLYTFLSP